MAAASGPPVSLPLPQRTDLSAAERIARPWFGAMNAKGA